MSIKSDTPFLSEIFGSSARLWMVTGFDTVLDSGAVAKTLGTLSTTMEKETNPLMLVLYYEDHPPVFQVESPLDVYYVRMEQCATAPAVLAAVDIEIANCVANGYSLAGLFIDRPDRSFPVLSLDDTGYLYKIYRHIRNIALKHNLTAIVQHPFSSEAHQLKRSLGPNWLKEQLGGGYYRGSRMLDQEVDSEISIDTCGGSEHVAILGKHRGYGLHLNRTIHSIVPRVNETPSILLEILKDEIDHYLDRNPSAIKPYHNNVHMCSVWDIAQFIWEKEKVTTTSGSRQDVTIYPEPDATMSLMLAAMFHDFGHSGGVTTDSVNIETAIGAVLEFYKTTKTFSRFKRSNGDVTRQANVTHLFSVAVSAIRCTEFPFVTEPQGLLQECLRDADLLYTAIIGKPELVLEDLREEMEVRLGRKITYTEMLEGQKTFLNNATLYTETGKQLWAEKAAPFYAAMETYVEKVNKIGRGLTSPMMIIID